MPHGWMVGSGPRARPAARGERSRTRRCLFGQAAVRSIRNWVMTSGRGLAIMSHADEPAGGAQPSLARSRLLGGYRVKERAAGRRSATVAKQPGTSTPHWRKRRRQTAHQAGTSAPVIHGTSGAAALRKPASPVAMMESAVARLGTRFAALPAIVRRLGAIGAPVEPVPASWVMVGVMDPAAPVGMASASTERGLEPATRGQIRVGEPADEPAMVAVAAVGSRATPSRDHKSSAHHSIKNGPPKAPRTRRGTQTPLGPVTLPDVVVPVMVAITAPSDVPAPDRTPEPLADVTPDVGLAAAPPEPASASIVVAMPVMQAPDKPRVIDPGHDVGVERARSTMAQRIGDDAERLAAIRLEALGWRILARNLRVSRVEIDLLAIDPSDPPTLVVVEVRHRSRRDFGLAEETVDYRKRAALRRAAGELASRSVLPDGRRIPALPVRIDLIAIDRGPDGRPALRHHRGIEA